MAQNLWEQLAPRNLAIMSSKHFLITLRAYGLPNTLQVDLLPEFNNIYIMMLLRTVVACILLCYRRKWNVIYAASDFVPDVFPSWLHKTLNPRTRWVQRIHHPIPPNRLIPHLAQRFTWQLIRSKADCVLVLTQASRDNLIRQHFDNSKIAVLPPGSHFLSIYALRHLPETQIRFLSVGRLHPSKGYHDLLLIMKHLSSAGISFVLTIVGGGSSSDVNHLISSIIAFTLTSNVTVLTDVTDDDLIELYKRAHLYISCSREEGYGIAIADALASGLPVIAWDLEVYRSAFPRGIIRVPVGSTSDFTTALSVLLRNESAYTTLCNELKHQPTLSWTAYADAEWANFLRIAP